MEARMPNPAVTIPGAYEALIGLTSAASKQGVPHTTLEMVHLRASQINGCSVCVEMHSRDLKQSGESDERIWGVAAWREMPYYSDAERAALALTEALTRIADRPDPVSDELWAEVARHYDEAQIGSLLIHIGTINVWNRLNAATRQVAGAVRV